MGKDYPFRNSVGISTLSLKGIPLEEAIDIAHKAEFRVFELAPWLYGGPERFGRQGRKALKEKLACFKTLTMHSSGPTLPDGRRVNIASSDPSYRRESVEHYLAHIQLALDVGVKVLTFHPGTGDEKTSSAQVREANFTFGQTAAEIIKGAALLLGYEYFDTELTREIGHRQFGMLFDIGHAAALEEDSTAVILRLLKESCQFIVQFHVHGVRVASHGIKQDHQSLSLNDTIDYAQVMCAIKRYGFAGPFIFEIGIGSSDIAENLKESVWSKKNLVNIWEGC